MNTRSSGESAPSARGWYLLLLVPFIAILWVPFYAGGEPALFGFPFFYWYQFLWIFISAGITALVYFMTREPENGMPVGEALDSEDNP